VSTPRPPWPEGVIDSLSAVLAATDWPGLKGPEITRLLESLRIDDPWPSAAKRHRLSAALVNRQVLDRSSRRLVTFVVSAMAPSRYIGDPNRFAALQASVNEVLSMVSLRINDKGQMAQAKQARTLDEVAQLTGRLRGELTRRGVHAEVLRYCEQELLRRSIFHAIFEATKGLSQRLRQMSGSALDGAELVDACFTKQEPVIRISDNTTKSEASEQAGFANLLRGITGTFRNPTAHAPRTEWPVSEADALDLFSMLSYLHRRLDKAVVARRS
jgi:uncharacterized protein (TIGR02391 family)